MAAALPFISVAMSVIGAMQQGSAAKQASDYNSAQNQRNSTIALQQANADAERKQRDNVRLIGHQRAGYAAAGVTLDGSPLDVLEDSAAIGELNVRQVRYAGELKSIGFLDTANLDAMRGENAQTASYFSAGKELIGGYGAIKRTG